jgi:3-oxoacyl-[acyl-carrier protein] reductase
VWTYDAAPADVDRMMDINAKGLMHGTNAALKVMVANRSGHIINVASLAGVIPVPGLAIYSASKHAARAYSIAAGVEVRDKGVYVSVICPAVVATPMMDDQMHREEAALTFSTKRPLTVDEVCSAIIDCVMTKKPLELLLDVPGTRQAILAKLGNAFPELALKLRGRMTQLGRLNQHKWRAT